MSIRSIFSATLCIIGVCFSYTQNSYAVQVDEQAIVNPGSEWLSYGRDYQEQRFSPLKQLNRENVAELDLAWSFKFSTARGM